MPYRIRVAATAVALSLLMLQGCGSKEQAPVAEPVRPVKSMVVAAPEAGGLRNFPARIDAINKAEMAFRVAGKVVKLPIKEGDLVEKGQLLAALDPTDFQIVVKDRQATYNRTRKDYERAKELIKKGHISRRDYDRTESDFKNASAALQQAKQDLAYTQLKAPFEATVARRYIERHEEVQAKQPVLALSDTSALKVKIDVPENIIQRIDSRQDRSGESKLPVWASFDAVPGKRFPLTFKEVVSRADPQTQTFEVTFAMETPQGLTVLPGMTATVTADLSGLGRSHVYYLPLTAVAGNDKLQPRVWVVDAKTLTVHARPVKLGPMRGARIEVTEGIEAGDRVVTAGSAHLAEGMKVRLMKQVEQAEPRPDDLCLMLKQ